MSNITKDELVDIIKEWVSVDKELKALSKEVKNRRDLKKELTQKLANTLKINEIDNINTPNGKIIYSQNKVRAPLNKKHLIKSTMEFFGDSSEEEIEKLNALINHILESREIKLKDNIRLKE